MNIWKEFNLKEEALKIKFKCNKKMSETELNEKIKELEKRIEQLEKSVSYIQEDIYEFVEDDECSGNCSSCKECKN